MNITFVNTKKVTKQLPQGRTWPFPSSVGGNDETKKPYSISNVESPKEREPFTQKQTQWQPPEGYRYGD